MTNRPSPKESERRIATVVFADISGFTSMSEHMDPEEVTSIMNRCFGVMEQIVKKYGGTIDKFMGDCVMALFGVPMAVENAPHRAINTAIEMRNCIYRFNREQNLAIPLDIHVGINTGPVLAGVVGGVDRKDYTVMGDTVNLAKRLEEASEKGQIIVGPSTYRAVKDAFEFREFKTMTVKGKEDPITIHELLTRQETVYRPRSEFGKAIQSVMVGRDKEWSLLELQVLKAINGEGSIVTVIGEAGIGKSRLVAELLTGDIVKRVTLLKGRAVSMGRNLSFHPIIDLFKNWAGILERDNNTTAFDKLFLAARNVYPEGTDEVLPFVATLMGMKLPPRYCERVKGIEGEALERLTNKSVQDLLVAIAKKNPLVMILEDMHWADNSSILLVETLLGIVKANPITMILVFRPNYQETGERLRKTILEKCRENNVEILIDRLSEDQSEQLITNLLSIKGLKKGVREQILERSGGNPFFIEEVVRTLIEEGAVILKNGSFEITDRIDNVIIPQTIQEVLMARVDRMDEQTKSVVKIASVIGRSFFHKILFEVARSAEDIEDIETGLDYLKKVEFIQERKRMEELEFLFKHVLAQEATYESILHKKREELHLKVADSIERVFAEKLHEFYGMLAYHYSFGNPVKAEEYLIKAGEESLKSSASSEALIYYRQALKLYEEIYGAKADPAKVAMLERNVALALFNRGIYSEAITYFLRALTFYGEKSSKNRLTAFIRFILYFIDLHIALFLPFLKWRKTPKADDLEIIGIYAKILTAYVHIDQRMMFIRSFYFSKSITPFDLTKIENGVGLVASMSFYFSWTGISLNMSRQILRHIKKYIDGKDLKTTLYYEFADLNYKLLHGDWSSIKPYDPSLVPQTLRLGELFFCIAYLTLHGRLLIDRGDLTGAVNLIEEMEKIGTDFEHDFSKAIKLRLNTLLFFKARRLREFNAEMEKGSEFSRKAGFTIILFFFYSIKAQERILMNDLDGAEKLLVTAKESISESSAAPYYRSDYLLSRFLLDITQLEVATATDARANVSELKTRAHRSGMEAVRNSEKTALDRTEIFRLMGTYYWLTGDYKKAASWWERSIKEGKRLGAQIELSRTYAEVGRRLSGPKSKLRELGGTRADRYLDLARVNFENMGLQWDIDDLDNLRG